MNLLLRMEEEFDGRLNVCEEKIMNFESIRSVLLEQVLYDTACELQRKMQLALDKFQDPEQK